jgi:predicted aldo/keto reductase-like oxidoreductase
VLVPLNVVTRQALEELVPAAKKMDVGVVAMKPLSAKTSKLITCLYQPSLSLVSDEPELKAMLGETADARARSALRFVLSQDIAVTVPGLQTVEEATVAAQTGNEYTGFTEEEKKRFAADLSGEWCRDCGLCLPCPEGIDVAAALRFYALAERYGLKAWAGKLYHGLDMKADKCNGCGVCEPKCPYGQPIQKMLMETHAAFAEP